MCFTAVIFLKSDTLYEKRFSLVKRKMIGIRFYNDCYLSKKTDIPFLLTGEPIHFIPNTYLFFLYGILFFCSGITTYFRDSAYFRDSRYIHHLQ